MNLKAFFILSGIFLFGADTMFGQPAETPIKYLNAETFSVNNGLSQGLVNCITQDNFGFLWLGTLDGLNRYDGYNVSVFRHDPDDSHSISENFITCVFEDSKKRLWVGTNSQGLNLFDYENEGFIHFAHRKDVASSLSDNRIISIEEDNFGAIWIATKNGLNKIIDNQKVSHGEGSGSSFGRPGQFVFKHIQFDSAGTELFMSHDATTAIESFTPSFFIDLNGFVLVKTEYAYFSVRPSATGTDTVIKMSNLKPRTDQEKKISQVINVTGLGREMADFLFLMSKSFVTQIDAATGIVSMQQHPVPCTIKRHNTVACVDGNIWFTYNFHLYQYIQASLQVMEIRSREESKEKLLDHSISPYKDRTGIIWVGTGGYGAVKFNTANEKFHSTKSSSIHWLHSGKAGRVIMKEGDSVYLLQRKIAGPDSSTWIKDSNFFKDIYGRLKGNYLGAAIEKDSGIVWLQAKGILKYDLKNKMITSFLKKPLAWCAIYTDEENKCWFADETMLSEITRPLEQVVLHRLPVKGMAADFYVETIYKDAQHILWIGTTYGLFSFDEKQQQWIQYSFRSNDSTSISSNLVLSICQGTDKNILWIGTNGGGFNQFDKRSGKFKRYTIRDGLPNNVVYGILTDDNGNLWMSTNNGISNFNIITKKFDNYTVEDGLQDNEFNRHAYCKTPDGTLFFGGINGYNHFDPKEINNHQLNRQVIITDIKTNGESINFHQSNSPLSLPSYLTKKISLNFKNNSISFDFSAMHFKTYTHDKYQYMLQGIDKDWVSSASNRSAVYSNLQPGRYIFKVKIGTSDRHYTALDIVILPPWYLTWWFTMLIIILVAALVYSFYRYNLNNAINRYKDHQRIASDLHDEIGSTLSSIHIYSEVAISKTKSRPFETETYLGLISNSVENTIGSLDDIVWALKSKDDRFEDIGNRMRAAAVSICEASGYKLNLSFDDHLYNLKFGKETRKNLFLIYKEAINNVMKYAKGKNLHVNLSAARDLVVLSVMDDGKGFDEKQKGNGNGLGNMQKRAKELNGKLEIISSPGNGTKIILTFYSSTSR